MNKGATKEYYPEALPTLAFISFKKLILKKSKKV
jgi:hypothetical protein